MAVSAVRAQSRRVAVWALGAAFWIVPGAAWAVTIQVDSIAGVSGKGYTPETRLGLGQANVNDATKPHVINIADCLAIKAHASPHVDVKWTWTDRQLGALASPTYGVKLAPGGKSCDANTMTESNKDSGCIILAENKTFGSIADSKPSATVTVDLKALLGETKCEVGVVVEPKIYFIVSDQPTITATGVVMSVTLDLAAPKAPTLTALGGGNDNLKVTWEHAEQTDKADLRARVYWSKQALTAENAKDIGLQSAIVSGTSHQLTGLDNNQTYYVAVTAVDKNDNESTGSVVKSASPKEVQDFWQYYKANAGAEEGGYGACSARPVGGGWGGFGALGLAGLGLLFWRRRRLRVLPMLLGLATVAGLAQPQSAWAESPRTMSVDLRFTQYTPGIDREFAGAATPYADVFGEDAWQFGFTADWRLFHGIGEVALGLGMGTWSKEGVSRAVGGGETQDKSNLSIVPLTVDAVYRFDWMAERWNFPLVPYAKVGLAYSLWWVEDGVDETSVYKGLDANKKETTSTGSGGTGGFHGTLGLRIQLDPFEPQAARSFDIEMGVNHSYVYAEYQKLSLNDFGNPKSIDLSADLFVFGLAFDL